MMTNSRLPLSFLAGGLVLAALILHPNLDVWAQQSTPPSDPPSAPKVDFATQIQPVLARSCHSCHGAKLQMGQLRLDAKEAAFAGGQSGKTIIPGAAGESTLYQRVAGTTDQARMPMGSDPLSGPDIALIRAWIEQGAEWPEGVGAQTAEIKKHWAYIKPERPAQPKVKNETWPKNPIDYFVLARLENEGLPPSSEADRVTLLRRLSLDLIGLPPTLREVDAFLADTSKDAYRNQVERLLASPHYGERWGRIWLDAARYADSDGFEKDKPRDVWFYRDWVINAFNRDLPYDEFVIEQIAGDLLPDATQSQNVATGFLRNSMVNEEGGIDPEQFRMEAMFDRMDAIGKSVLGITIQCAQCHNHKYDPLTQKEYYRLFSFLNNSYEGAMPVYTPEQQTQREQIHRRIRELEDGLKRDPVWQKRIAAWEEQAANNQPEWLVVRPTVDDISTGGQKYRPMEDGSFLAGGYAPTKHRVKMTLETEVENITGFRLELMKDFDLPFGGPGRSVSGTAALSEFEVFVAPKDKPDDEKFVVIGDATANLNLPEKPLNEIYYDKSTDRRLTGPITMAIDGCNETAWSTDADPIRRNQPRNAVFAAAEPIANAGGTILTFYLSQMHGGWNSDAPTTHNLGRFRLSITTTPNPQADPLPKRVREILAVPREQRTPQQAQQVFSYWRTTVPEWKAVNDQIERIWASYPEPSSQLVLHERDKMRDTHRLERGDFLKPAEEVEPGVPAFLHPVESDGSPDRLTFAKWLVDRDSPTTARSIVNRVWQAYFGRGLVATSEDLGLQSQPPSHPQLLDWLAVEFMDHGWSFKHLQRLITTSATYRQSSQVTPELLKRDVYNELLARGPRFRVDAEIVRDIALSVSGLLNPELGGPSVYPPAPEFLFKPPASYGPKNWHTETGADRYRRAVYTFRYRSVPYPVLQTFDGPNGDFSCVRRDRSNTPLQALTTLNETLFMESARALALQTLRDAGPGDPEKLAYAFRRCLSRKPTPAEADELLSLFGRQRERFEKGAVDPWKLAANDPQHPPALPASATPSELAAWTAVSRVLLNLDETITKE